MAPDAAGVAPPALGARPRSHVRDDSPVWAADPRVRLVVVVAIGLLGAVNLLWRLDRADWHFDEWLYAVGGWEAIHARSPAADHPLLGKYLIGLGQVLFGRGSVGVRLVPALCSLAATVAVFGLARRIAGWWAGALGALLWATLPRSYVVAGQTTAFVRGDRFALLDTIANALALFALLAGWRWIERPGWPRAAVAGLVVGLMASAKLSTAGVAVVVVLAGVALIRPWAEAAAQAALAAAVAGLTFVVTYLPLGADGPDQFSTMVANQRAHLELGHRVVLDGSVWDKEPWWANTHSWVAAQGPLLVAALVVAALGAWWSRERLVVAYLWVTTLGVALALAASPVALAHYWTAWLGPLLVLAAGGVVSLARDRTPRRVLALALALVLLGSGAWATGRIATAPDGDYQRAMALVRAEAAPPQRALTLGSAIEPYFPDAVSVFATLAPGVRPDVVVIERQFALQVDPTVLVDLRRRAEAAGLTPRVFGDVELWYRPR